MGKTEKDSNGLKLGFLKTVQPNSFSKLIPSACNFKYNAIRFQLCCYARTLFLTSSK